MNAWDVAATEQALSDARVVLVNAQVMAFSAHELAANWLTASSIERSFLVDAVLAAHDATTPSPTRTHVVVSEAYLAWLGRVVSAAEVASWGHVSDLKMVALRQVLAEKPGVASCL